MPYPVVGGFLAGVGWLLLKGGVYVAAHLSPFFKPFGDLLVTSVPQRWLPALAFGVILLVAVRVIKRPLVIPAVIAIGLVVFVIGMVVTGSSVDDVRGEGWLLGSFDRRSSGGRGRSTPSAAPTGCPCSSRGRRS